MANQTQADSLSTKPVFSFKNWYLMVIGIVLTIIGFINEIEKILSNPFLTQALEIAGFLLITFTLLDYTRSSDISAKWRRISLGTFYVISLAFTVQMAWWFWGNSRLFSAKVSPIEKVGITSGDYGRSYLFQTVSVSQTGYKNIYRLDFFDMTQTNPGIAGFFMKFNDEFNALSYKNLQFTAQLSDDTFSFFVILEDNRGIESTITVGKGSFFNYQPEPQTVKIPLSLFANVDLSSLRQIDFYTDQNLVKDGEDRFLIISDIEFVK